MLKIFHLVVYRFSSGLFVLISIDSGKAFFAFSRFKVSDLELEIAFSISGSEGLSTGPCGSGAAVSNLALEFVMMP